MLNNNLFITEQNTQTWANMITEEFGVQDKNKLAWVSEVAAIHEAYENMLGVQGTPAGGAVNIPSQGVGPMYATALNTPGMGNPAAPAALDPNQVTTVGGFMGQRPGSGDIPMSTLPMALNVALMTIGLELVPVIPSKGPWHLLTYLDFPYAGGKHNYANNLTKVDGRGAGRENKPLFIKLLGDFTKLRGKVKEGDAIVANSTKGSLYGYFKQWGRMDGGLIMEVAACTTTAKGNNVDFKTVAAEKNIAIVDIFGDAVTVRPGVTDDGFVAGTTENGTTVTITTAWTEGDNVVATKADYVQTSVDLIDGYANFATGKKEAMTRAQNETGTGNTIGLRVFSKWIEMGSYEVTGQVTRQQLQDLPLYGVDAVSDVMQAMQNELTQHINQRILESVFRLGVQNAVQQKAYQGVDLNLYMGTADSKALSTFGVKEYADASGVDHLASWGNVKNSLMNTSAENVSTVQRRISSRVLAAANLIYQTSRRGRGTFIVTNAAIASALQDVSGYVVAPMANTLSQTSDSLYHAGTLGGLQVYVDPYMNWDDTRICVGRKGGPKEPGLVFMPYILADQVSIVAEGTMAQKMLVNSRFAIVPVGYFPEASYYTFCVSSDSGLI